MHCCSKKTLSLGPSKFWNYDPQTTMRVHTQLNHKRKLEVDQIKPSLLNRKYLNVTMCMESADRGRP